MEEIQGRVVVEDLEPADIMSAIGTMPSQKSARQGVCLAWPGEKSPDDLIAWALKDIADAMDAKDAHDQERAATNAVMNARRALDCLVEAYLNVFAFRQCKGAPETSWDKSEHLRGRQIVDKLTHAVLARAIDLRNKIEHKFSSADLDQAQDIVELLRRVCGHLPTLRDPTVSTCLFNLSCGCGTDGHHGIFNGWQRTGTAGLVIATFAKRPWLGILTPDSKSSALLRQVPLAKVPIDVVTQIWDHFGSDRPAGAWGSFYWLDIFRKMGFPGDLC